MITVIVCVLALLAAFTGGFVLARHQAEYRFLERIEDDAAYRRDLLVKLAEQHGARLELRE